ncbi:MAG: hypothetical protein JOZ41_00120, partial [Chloroflexi bacterium]|nr:hypothetical protein [Chloroflexota bacterium]
MRIGLDATWAGRAGTGTASYTRGLVRALVEHVEHHFLLYVRGDNRSENPLVEMDRPNVTVRAVDG